MPANLPLPEGYDELLNGLKTRVQRARISAGLAVNRELVILYWQIGKDIIAQQQNQGWGAKVIERLAADLQHAFPEMKGFSRTNLLYMRAFAGAYPEEEFVQQVVGQIPWGHNIRVLDLVKDPIQREWYIRKTVEHGWSRNVLVHQIQSGLYNRQGGAATNFALTLPPPHSDLARDVLKDPYNFDFLALTDDVQERELERALVEHIRDFLLELGVGFAFVGSQYHLEVAGEDFYIDLLFYHLKLRCYVVIELKATDFKPEYSGKVNFYLSAVDDILRHPDDQPSVGIIICKTRNKLLAEYALRDVNKPIGISQYELTKALPESLTGSLPTIEELEQELSEGVEQE